MNRTGLNLSFQAIFFTTVRVVFITARIAFIFTSFKISDSSCNIIFIYSQSSIMNVAPSVVVCL